MSNITYELQGRSLKNFHEKLVDQSVSGIAKDHNVTVSEALRMWREAVMNDQIEPDEPEGFNILHEVWSPKIKWFKPPMWKIFRWAYNIKKTLYTGCYPVSISGSSHIAYPPREVNFEFTSQGYCHQKLEEYTHKLMENSKNQEEQRCLHI